MAPSISGLSAAASAVDKGSAKSQALWQAAEKFEAIFVSRILNEMRAVKFGPDGLSGPGSTIYRSMLDQQLATHIASRDPFGIAKLLVQQLGGAGGSGSAQPPGQALDHYQSTGLSSVASTSQATPAASPATSVAAAKSFASRLMPLLSTAAAELHTSPRVLLGQAALETGWGQHVPQTESGSSSHNLFGVKADPSWGGSVANASTREFLHAQWQTTQANFRAYPNIEAAVKDFVHVVGQVLSGIGHGAASTASEWGRLLEKGGYATDPGYVSKLKSVVDGPLMSAVMSGATSDTSLRSNVSLSQASER